MKLLNCGHQQAYRWSPRWYIIWRATVRYWQEETGELRKTCSSATFPTTYRTWIVEGANRVSAVRGWRLTTWAMARLNTSAVYRAEVLKLVGRSPLGGVVGPRGRGVVFMRDIFTLNEMWAKGKIYILVGILLGWYTLLFTYYRHWLRPVTRAFGHRLMSAFFRCHNTPTNRNEMALL
jgi:hypothetical protein